jgi:hypothetical protein
MGVIATQVVGTPIPSLRSQIWHFARHLVEMCVVMCGMGTPLVLLLFVWGRAVVGYPDPRQQFLELSVLATGAIYTLPMVFWMRFRGMAWRPVLEMGAATVGLGILVVGLGTLGVLPLSSLREFASPTYCGPACLLMVLVMLPRLDLYAGRTGHTMHRQPASQ